MLYTSRLQFVCSPLQSLGVVVVANLVPFFFCNFRQDARTVKKQQLHGHDVGHLLLRVSLSLF